MKDGALSTLRSSVEVDVKRLPAIGTMKLPGTAYREVSGGPVELFHGSIVEGSVDKGGLQPHYVVDLHDKKIEKLLVSARKLTGKGFDQRCAGVRALVAKALSGKTYDQPGYLKLMQSARKAQANVRPGDYLRADAGVCREHAMLTHLALREAGVNTRYLYVKVYGPDGNKIEDHALALAFDDAKLGKPDASRAWIVDSYNKMFDGRRLEVFLRPQGSSDRDESRGDVDVQALPKHWFGYTVRVLPYPHCWIPVRTALAPNAKIDVKSLDFSKVRVVRWKP